jgi:hypothetical protein
MRTAQKFIAGPLRQFVSNSSYSTRLLTRSAQVFVTDFHQPQIRFLRENGP